MGIKSRNIIKRISSATGAAAILLGGLSPAIVRANAAVTMSLSSSVGSLDTGNNFVITMKLTTAGSATDVTAQINYDTSKVSYVGADFSTSPFDQDFGSTNNTGYYKVDRYKLGGPYPSGTVDVVKLTFKANAAGGASFSISGASAGSGDPADSGAALAPQTVSGTSITITTPAPPPSSGGGGSSGGGSGSTGGTSGSTGGSSGGSTGSSSNSTNNTTQNPPSSGGEQTSEAAKKYSAKIKVINDSGEPQKNLDVAIGDTTKTTDENGEVVFEDLAAGKYTVKYGGKEVEVTVVEGETTQAQEFNLSLLNEKSASPSKIMKYLWISLAVVGVGAVIFAALVLPKKFIKNRAKKGMYSKADFVATDAKPELSHEEAMNKVGISSPHPETVITPDNKDPQA